MTSRLATLLLAMLAFSGTLWAQTPTPPALTGEVDGLAARLQWTHPDWQVSYRLEAGTTSGASDAAVVSLPSYYHEYTAFPVPDGTYYVRVRAVLGAAVSEPSNEVVLTFTGCPPPPSPALTGTVSSGSVVNLSWVYNFATGCGPDHALVEAGLSPGATDIGSFPVIGFSGVQFQNVPFGTYYTRVRLVRGGVAGPPSNEVTLPVLCAAPPAFANARADVVGNGARFSWEYAGTTTAAFTVSLEAGSVPGAADLATLTLPDGAHTGFNAHGPPGTYYTRLRATNVCGSTVSADVPVTLTSACPTPGPIPFVDAQLGIGGPLTVRWEPPSSGGLVSSYQIGVGSSPGSSDLASRTVDGRWVPPLGFSETIGGIAAPSAYLHVTPTNACGQGPRSFDARAQASCHMPALSGGTVTVVGPRASMGWGFPSQSDPLQTYVVEIGRSLYASDVLTSAEMTAVYPATPAFSVDLPPGVYYARARRIYAGCSGRSNPSRELFFTVVP